jgi:hypothetical protein
MTRIVVMRVFIEWFIGGQAEPPSPENVSFAGAQLRSGCVGPAKLGPGIPCPEEPARR